MAKKPKKAKKTVSMTPAKTAYQVALDNLYDTHSLYLAGQANDENHTTPGKQRKVAKQIAKLHNRLLKKSGLDGLELDEDAEAPNEEGGEALAA